MVRSSARVGSSRAVPPHYPDPEESVRPSELLAAHLSVVICGSAPVWLQWITVSVTKTAPGVANGIGATPHAQHPRKHLVNLRRSP